MKREDLVPLLPGVFQRTANPGGLLNALLDAMTGLLDPVDDVLGRTDEYIDPRRAPEAFLGALASWVDLERVLEPTSTGAGGTGGLASGSGNLRELIAVAGWLSHWRGTSRGLVRFLETATGCRGFSIDENPADPGTGQRRSFHMTVVVPEIARAYEPLIRRIVSQEKPVSMTSELRFGEEPAH